MDNPSLSMAIIGVGPRGLSVFERLTVHAGKVRDRVFDVSLIDPYPPGAGKIWRREQPRLYVMNTPGLFPTVVPTDEQNLKKSVVSGVSFDVWRQKLADPETERYGVVSPEDEEELRSIAASGSPSQQYPSRVLYGTYLCWIYECLLHNLPENIRVTYRERKAVRVVPEDGGGRPKFCVGLDDGSSLAVDDVVLAMGHVPVQYAEQQRKFLKMAEPHGPDYKGSKNPGALGYFPAVVPSCAVWDDIPEGQDVLVRGLGLNFFDLMAQVTQGRGGRFASRGDGELVYQASGREPRLIAGSRRGVPYHAKPVISGYYAEGATLRCFDVEALRYLAREGRDVSPEGLSFRRDLWPRLKQDMQENYYNFLAAERPEVFVGDAGEFLERYKQACVEFSNASSAAAEEAARRIEALTDRNVREPDRFDFALLADPFAEKYFYSPEEHLQAVMDFIRDDIKRAYAGTGNPVGAVIEVLRKARAVFKTLVDEKAVDPNFQGSTLFSWFESAAAFLSSGPPVLRMQQLLALAEAGIVDFVGPSAQYDVDDREFRAVSRHVADGWKSARVLVDAFSPPNQVANTADELLQRLIADGVAALKMVQGEDMMVPSGLDVSQCPYQVLNRKGEVVKGLYVIGLQLSAVQLGTTTAAEAYPRTPSDSPSGSYTLHDADAIARNVTGSSSV